MQCVPHREDACALEGLPHALCAEMTWVGQDHTMMRYTVEVTVGGVEACGREGRPGSGR